MSMINTAPQKWVTPTMAVSAAKDKIVANAQNAVSAGLAQQEAGKVSPTEYYEPQAVFDAPQGAKSYTLTNPTPPTLAVQQPVSPVPNNYTVPINPAPASTGTPMSVPTPAYVPLQSLTDLNKKATDNMTSAFDVNQSQLSGKAYDPYALQTQQALSRAEANARAKTASAIHSAGFAGTPLGISAGNAMESDLLRNRFDTNLGIEVERQNLKNTGIGNAMALGDTVNKWQTDDQNRARSLWDWEADAQRLPKELEGMDWANKTSAFNLDAAGQRLPKELESMDLANEAGKLGLKTGDLNYYNAYRDQTTKKVLADPALLAVASEEDMEKYLSANPNMRDALAFVNGGASITAADAMNLVTGMKNEADVGYQLRQYIKQIKPDATEQEIDIIMGGSLEAMLPSGTKIDGNGDIVKDTETSVDDSVKAYKTGREDFSTFTGTANDPVYKALLKATPDSGGTLAAKSGSAKAGSSTLPDKIAPPQEMVATPDINSDGGPGLTRMPVLEEALSKNTPVNLGGVLYVVVSKTTASEEKRAFQKDLTATTTYTLFDPLTGVTHKITTTQGHFND